MDDMKYFSGKTSDSQSPMPDEMIPSYMLDFDYVVSNMIPESERKSLKHLKVLYEEDGLPIYKAGSCSKFWEWLSHIDPFKPMVYLDKVYRTSCKSSKFSPVHLLWLWHGLTARMPFTKLCEAKETYEENNIIYNSLVLEPLNKLLTLESFDWRMLADIKYPEDYARLYAILSQGISNQCFKVLQECSVEPDLCTQFSKHYKNNKLNLEAFKKETDKQNYLERLNMLYYDPSDAFVQKYQDILPSYVLSAMLVIRYLGAPCDKLDVLNAKISSKYFWKAGIGMKEVIFTEEGDLTEDHFNNLIGALQVAGGDPEYFTLDGSPILSVAINYVRAYQGKKIISRDEDKTSVRWDKKFYFNPLVGNQYAIMEGAAPFNWGRVKNAIKSLLDGLILDINVNNYQDAGTASSVFTTVGLQKQPAVQDSDNYSICSLAKLLATMDRESSLGLLKDIISIGNKINCHDPYFCYCLKHLLLMKAPVKFWMTAYIRFPLLIDTCLFKAIVAYKLGAKDYKSLFFDTKNGFKELRSLSKTINAMYNKMSAAVLKFWVTLKLNADELPLSLDLQDHLIFHFSDKDVTVHLTEIMNNTFSREVYRAELRNVRTYVVDGVLNAEVIEN